MKKNDFIRPEIIAIESNNLQVELSLPNPIYNDDETSLIDILIAPTLVILTQEEGEAKPNLLIDAKMFNKEIYEKFNQFTYSIGKLVRLAELNLDTLQDVLELYFSKNPIEEVLERNKKCKECKEYDLSKGMKGLTYGNLRKVISCIVKTDKNLHQIEILESSEKRSNFTSIYADYIHDRDRYTHGKLFFLYPDFEPTLRALNNGNDEYLKFTKLGFESNLKVFLYLQDVLNKIREVLK